MPHWPVGNWNHKAKYTLEYPLKLSAALGNPHLKLPPTIHVAGTNGKGSSIAMLKAIFEAAGYRVHTYASPHLVDFNERIILAGEKISDDYLYQIMERTRQAAIIIGEDPQFFFEGITIAAFLAFSEIEADILLLETGVGGRLDATNIIINPLLSLITPISYDHMNLLGNTLSLIAAEKSGIIKPHCPCVIAPQADRVYEVLLGKCDELNSSSFCYEYDFGIEKLENGFIYFSKNLEYEFPKISLQGDHQLINAGCVVAAITLINEKYNINIDQIIKGLQNTKWPCRIQKINPKKYSKFVSSNISIWLDGAHNDAGAMVLANWIKDNLKEPVYLILGMTKNRDVEKFCSFFTGLIESGYTVRVLSEVSSYNAENLQIQAQKSGINFLATDSLQDALDSINKLNIQSANIIITGSLYLTADFLKLIN
jgi:dihydrofolate synthase/folylpolyglutamate synthase